MQKEELKEQNEEKLTKIRETQVNQKNLDEITTRIQSYEDKVCLILLASILCIFLIIIFKGVPWGSIPLIITFGVSTLILVYYIRVKVQIKKLREQLEKKSK
jgi:uncharacterized membrane protein YjjP (DUF1212 family)